MRILVVAPTDSEFEFMNEAIASRSSLRHEYKVVGGECVGMSPAAACVAQALAEASEKFDLVADIGYAAGTLGYHQKDVVEPRFAAAHGNRFPKGFVPELEARYPLYGKDDCTIFTADAFVDKDSICEIKAREGVTNALFDMEAAGICIAAKRCGNVPVYVIKTISDVPEDNHDMLSYYDFKASFHNFDIFLDRLEAL